MLRGIWGYPEDKIFIWWQIQSRVVRDNAFQTSIPQTFVQIAQLWQQEAIHTEQGFVQPKVDKDKKGFISGIKQYLNYRKRGSPGGQSRPKYSSGDRSRIRVVLLHVFQNQIPHTFVWNAPALTVRGNPHSRIPAVVKIWQSQGGFIKLWD